MTIEQRQGAAEVWAEAYTDWKAAEEQASLYDNLRVQATTRLVAARIALEKVASVGPQVPTRVFVMHEDWPRAQLVKVTYVNSVSTCVELLKTEPRE